MIPASFDYVAPTSLAYQDALSAVTRYFAEHGATAAQARDLAIGWIGKAMQSQSVLLAYIDIFWLSALFAAAMVPLVLLMLKPVDPHAAPAAH